VLNILLSGGLGNQMFQFAFAKFIEHKKKEPFVLNTYLLNKKLKDVTQRNYELDEFSLSANIVDQSVLVGSSKLTNLLIRKGFFSKYCYESDFEKNASFYWGHWHDLQYLDWQKESLKRLFELKNPSQKFLNLQSEVLGQETVAVHVRRGDYISNPKAAKHHNVLSKDYYNEALKKLRAKKNDFKVYLFSDDPQWCLENLEGEVIDLNTTSAEELILMSSCSNHIIANSSYSWWAAFLNQSRGQTVIYPHKWFLHEANPNIFYPNWISV
jgi:hypothetical protein